VDIVEGVRKLGFRKWYERKLIEAHAWLIAGFLALILAFSLIEVRNDTLGAQQRFVLMAAFVATLAGAILAWLRYHHVLEATELAAELAVCPHCGTYGRLSVVRSAPQADDAMAANPLLEDLPHLRVRCRKCTGEWQLEPPA
jgi:formate dehydrogenase maturation protein FdhE